MKKKLLAIVAGALALTACGNVTGPDESAASAAKAKQALEAAANAGAEMSLRLSSN